MSLFEPQAIMVTPTGNLAGKAAIRAYLSRVIDQMDDLEFELLDLVASGDVALERLSYTLSIRSATGERVPTRATSNVILRRQAEGGWLIAIDHPGP
jgi:ketosteroid isomerase-like protein